MSLESLSEQISVVGKDKKLPPVELWDPEYCGELDMVIKSDGTWLYQGTSFKRISLVKLFASVLKKEANDYFLVTPVEKIKIQVEDAPFLLTGWRWLDEQQTTMVVETNLADEFALTNEHPVMVTENGNIYVTVRRNLVAKVHRNVYYQWIELAKEEQTKNGTEIVFYSAEQRISLGELE